VATDEKMTKRVPVRKCGIDTRDKIMQAAKELFFEKGYERTTTRDIASRAGISLGSVYTYFKEKKALLNHVIPVIFEDMLSRVFTIPINDLIDKGDMRGLVRALITSMHDAHSFESGVYMELLSMSRQDPVLADLISKEEMKYLDFFDGFFQNSPHHLKVKDFATAAELVYRVCDEIIHRICFFGTKSDGQKLLKELEDMLCAYLFHEFPADQNLHPGKRPDSRSTTLLSQKRR